MGRAQVACAKQAVLMCYKPFAFLLMSIEKWRNFWLFFFCCVHLKMLIPVVISSWLAARKWSTTMLILLNLERV